MMCIEQNYLDNARSLFHYYKSLGDKALAQIQPNNIHYQIHSESNSIAIIVKHMTGNMLSRWTDFLNSDGEKTWRNRDSEFENDIANYDHLLEYWEKGWQCLFDAIQPLEKNDLERIVYIRNEGHSVMEAINRQLAHYSYHVGQLVFLSKALVGEHWQSLSIPKGGSSVFNQEKFNQEKARRNFV